MFYEVFKFELKFQLRQSSVWIWTAFLCLFAFLSVASDAISIGGATSAVNRNAPCVIIQSLTVLSMLGVFVTTALVANVVNRDFELNMHSLFFSTLLTKGAYLGGRFLGALSIAFVIFVLVAVSLALGSLGLDDERRGPYLAAPYLHGLAFMVLPNLFLMAAIFFSLAVFTRSMMYTYVGVIAYLSLFALSDSLRNALHSTWFSLLVDSFGLTPAVLATSYWTVFERNTLTPDLTVSLLYNRLFWIAIGGTLLFLTFRSFKFVSVLEARDAKRKEVDQTEASGCHDHRSNINVQRTFGAGVAFRQFLRQTNIEIAALLGGVPFVIIVILAILNIVNNGGRIGESFGTESWPVTSAMIEVIRKSYAVAVVVLLAFFSGEVVWRERQLKLNELYDALPVPNWLFWAAKITTLGVMVVILQLIAMLTAIAFQLANGYTDIEFPVYASGLFFDDGLQFLLLAVLAFFFQTLGNNKYLSLTLLFISVPILGFIGRGEILLHYASVPPHPWSDMNGHGHFVQGVATVYAYWIAIAVLLLAVVHLFWPRDTETALRMRATLAWRRLTRELVAVLAIAAIAAVLLGYWIYYNTHVVNEHVTTDDFEQAQADLENAYKHYEELAQPRVIAVQADADLFPAERDAHIRGNYLMRNKTAGLVRELHVWLNPAIKERHIDIPGATVRTSDTKLGYTIYDLAEPLQPGATTTLTFDLQIRNDGFAADGGTTRFVENGTFFNNLAWFPGIGYPRHMEIGDPKTRREYGLKPMQRLPPLDDSQRRGNNQLGALGDWMTFETTVSTSADQIAIAPGYLQREWTENGRRYFHYQMDQPILGFWSYLSGRYTVRRDRWNDVAIEVYFHEPHAFNVDRMIDSVKKSLDYYTSHFGPYQHRQVRIIEFPGYESFAQSFPNTIPFSESIGFIARLKDPAAIDYVFYITAHEVAHQWWAHQVIGAKVQGATVLSESLAQYSALMVMEKEYGKETMRRFLEYELNSYLRGRGGERVAEMPLELVEGQRYIHYNKGSLVMYALRDYLGEDALNRALARFLADYKFAEPPYPTSRDLLRYIRAEASSDLQPLISDLFEKITIHENKATSAKATKRPDGKWDVTLEVQAKKYYTTGNGKEEPTTIGDLIDIGVLGPAPADKTRGAPVLYLEKHRIDQPKMTFEIVVDAEPETAGIDPLNKLIDRAPGDNQTLVAKRK